MLFLFLLLGSKPRLDDSHHSGPQEAGLYPETVPSPLPMFQSQKAQLVRDQGLPRGGGAASRALRSPCAASSGVAESQRGREPAAWRGWPRCWRSGRRAQWHLPGCPCGVAAQLCSPGGSAVWRGWPGYWRSGIGTRRHFLECSLEEVAWPYSPEGSAAALMGYPGPTDPGSAPGRARSLGTEALTQGMSSLGCEGGSWHLRGPGGR